MAASTTQLAAVRRHADPDAARQSSLTDRTQPPSQVRSVRPFYCVLPSSSSQHIRGSYKRTLHLLFTQLTTYANGKLQQHLSKSFTHESLAHLILGEHVHTHILTLPSSCRSSAYDSGLVHAAWARPSCTATNRHESFISLLRKRYMMTANEPPKCPAFPQPKAVPPLRGCTVTSSAVCLHGRLLSLFLFLLQLNGHGTANLIQPPTTALLTFKMAIKAVSYRTSSTAGLSGPRHVCRLSYMCMYVCTFICSMPCNLV